MSDRMTPERFAHLTQIMATMEWCGDGVHRELLDELTATRAERDALLAHIDALTAERDRFQRQGADLQSSYDEHCDAEDALRAERDALRARLDAAEAGIAAKLAAAVKQAENPNIDRGMGIFADGMVEGLEIAARIVGES